jgi:hypothetical protein
MMHASLSIDNTTHLNAHFHPTLALCCPACLLLSVRQILSNFGVDVLEALSSTCTLFTRHSIGLGPLVSDLLVAFLLITAHGSVLMCQVRPVCCYLNLYLNLYSDPRCHAGAVEDKSVCVPAVELYLPLLAAARALA